MVLGKEGQLFTLAYLTGVSIETLEEKYTTYMQITKQGVLLADNIQDVRKFAQYTRNFIEKMNDFETISDMYTHYQQTLAQDETYTIDALEDTLKMVEGVYTLTKQNFYTLLLKEYRSRLHRTLLTLYTNDFIVNSIVNVLITHKQFTSDTFLREVKKHIIDADYMYYERKVPINTIEIDDELYVLLQKHMECLHKDIEVHFLIDWNTYLDNADNIFKFTDNSTYYVDFDNIGLDNFMKLLNIAKGYKNSVFKLFYDIATTDTGIVFESGEYTDTEGYPVTIEVINVARLIGKKSIVDQFLIGTVMKDYYENQTNINQYIVSSDSDYFSISELGLRVKVIYADGAISHAYKKYLEDNDILHQSVTSLEESSMYKPVIGQMSKKNTLQYLSSLPLNQWTAGVIECYLSIMMPEEEAKIKLEDDYVKELTEYILMNTNITRQQGETVIHLEDIKIVI